VGKSCVLNALNLFYNPNIGVEERDYYANDTSKSISITLRFSNLTEYEKKLFSPYLEGDELSIEQAIPHGDKPRYYGTRFKNPEFDAFRNATGSDMRKEYNTLAQKAEYNDFPSYQNKMQADEVLQKWELSNKDKCERSRDEGQFFGFQNVGMHRMEKYTKFIFIPAVQEASQESVEERGSIFEEIMEIVVKSSLATNEELIKFETEAQQRYNELIDPSKNENLKGLEEKLAKNLRQYVPDSGVKIKWIEEPGVRINPPRAYVELGEGGYFNTVDRCGHGLQRAYIISLFQELAYIQSIQPPESTETDEHVEMSLPSLIVGIEEPELYQHPDRQRHLAKTLLELSYGGIKGAFENMQIVYSTHSPLMIDFLRFNQLRIFRKKRTVEENEPQETYVACTSLSEVSRSIEEAKELGTNRISDESLRQRLIPLMQPWMNEGFFANLIVLVEGLRDRALVLGQALSMKNDFESRGICVIPCSGKDSMIEPIIIFKRLGIPVYVVWDSDEGAHADPEKRRASITANRRLLKCHGCEPEDYPSGITDNYCCVRTDLEYTFKDEMGDIYERIVSEYCDERDLGKVKYIMENPIIMSELITIFKSKDKESETLKLIMPRIIEKYNALEIPPKI